MKIPVITFALVSLCPLFHAPALAQTTDALVDKYYHAFNTSDGTALLYASMDFSSNVPAASQGEVLAELIDRASKNLNDDLVISEAMLFISHNIVVTPKSHVEEALLAQVKNPSALVRLRLVTLLAENYPERYRAISLSFLDDPDDQVRVSAVDAIEDWKDAQVVFKKYIQDHDADPDRAKSVRSARLLRKDLQEPLSNGNSPAVSNAQSLGNGTPSAVANAPNALPSATTASVQTACSSDTDSAALRQAVMIVIGGSFSPDHLGPDRYEATKKLVSENAAKANQMLINEVLGHEEYTKRLSSLYILNVPELTLAKDLQGARQAAMLYKKLLDKSLKEFDSSANSELYLQGKSEEEGNEIRRLVQLRENTKYFLDGIK